MLMVWQLKPQHYVATFIDPWYVLPVRHARASHEAMTAEALVHFVLEFQKLTMAKSWVVITFSSWVQVNPDRPCPML